MHVLHEIVEMDAGFGVDVFRQGVEEEVHEHRFAATDVAEHVEAFWQAGRDFGFVVGAAAAAEDGAEEAFLFGLEGFEGWVDDLWRFVIHEIVVQVLERLY